MIQQFFNFKKAIIKRIYMVIKLNKYEIKKYKTDLNIKLS